MLSLSEAAKVTGQSKFTIWRAVKAGRLSATKTENIRSERSQTEMNVPTHHERQFMQYLRGSGWVKASMTPGGAMLIENLLNKGWIERHGVANDLSYRITDKGLAAKKMRVRTYR